MFAIDCIYRSFCGTKLRINPVVDLLRLKSAHHHKQAPKSFIYSLGRLFRFYTRQDCLIQNGFVAQTYL